MPAVLAGRLEDIFDCRVIEPVVRNGDHRGVERLGMNDVAGDLRRLPAGNRRIEPVLTVAAGPPTDP